MAINIYNDDEVSSSHNNGKLLGSTSEVIIPAGTRFAPNDQQLISYYLRNKVTNQFLVPCDKIRVANLYDYHPQQLTGMVECERDQEEWYYFTQRNRKYPRGCRPNRSTGNGYWKAVGSERSVKDNGGDNNVCGYRRSLDYYEGQFLKGTKTVWKMHEYRLMHHHHQPNTHHHPTNPMKMDEWVLCKIYKKRDSKATPNCGYEMSEQVASDSTSPSDQYPDDQENYVNTVSMSQPSCNIDDQMFDQPLMNLPNATEYDVSDLIAQGISSCHDHNQISNQHHQISCMLDDHHQMMNWSDWNNSWPDATVYDAPHHSIAHDPQHLSGSIYCYKQV
ncbi:hypothetical protein FNV43_RR06135 [Rhamnella rubrinervis]|uniref:NAC domain-containing protein n=1 Tax=Rhamnella rubrinervis TaxID=2594499 RepID=A0A8K0HCW5_9ROSA|nr:hypothetical protein FNV43_RR06135 [Rhamnella rubrinervis]